MIRFVAAAEEARAAHAGTLTEIRRPFTKANDDVPAEYRKEVGGSPSPAAAVFPDGSGKGWIAWWGRGAFTAEDTAKCYPGHQGIPCPLGALGDLLFVGEAWRSWTEAGEEEDEDGRGSTCWRQTYVAYEATPRRGYRPEPDREFITFLDDSSPLSWNRRLLGPWEPAEKLPVGFARTTLRNLGVRVERVGDVWTWIVSVETVMRDGKPVRPAEAG